MLKNWDIAFCTYFDKNYLPRGLAMIDSFIKFNAVGDIFVLCFDDFTLSFIQGLNRKRVIAVSAKEFEDRELLKVKLSRTSVEYYWTCTPSLPLYILNTFPKYRAVCYLDGDLYFFSSIYKVLVELSENSIYTVEHRYPPESRHQIYTHGRFNVAFQIFRNDKEGISCLKRWRRQCLKWCYARIEGGKMGDQMYLNEWPNRYKKLVISDNLGVDTAPWNVSQYQISIKSGKVYINQFPLICYHFHQLQICDPNRFQLATGYKFSKKVKNGIYNPYIKKLRACISSIQTKYPDYNIFTNRIKTKNRIISLITRAITKIKTPYKS